LFPSLAGLFGGSGRGRQSSRIAAEPNVAVRII